MANELIFDSSAKKTAVFLATSCSFPFPSTKTAIFMDSRLIFRFPSTETAIFMDSRGNLRHYPRKPPISWTGNKILNGFISGITTTSSLSDKLEYG